MCDTRKDDIVLNRIVIGGRLTADPELRRTQNGTAVASFCLACDRDFKNKETGETEADFINCVAWKGSAEFASNYFSKGRMAVVDGRLQMRDWTDKDGNKRRSFDVVVQSMYFCDSKKDETAYPSAQELANRFEELESDDVLPF